MCAGEFFTEQAKLVKTLRILSLRLRFEGESKAGSLESPRKSSLGATPKSSTPKPPPPKAPPVQRVVAAKEEEYEGVELEEEGESEYSYEYSEEECGGDAWHEAVDRSHKERKLEPPRRGAESTEASGSKKRKEYTEEVRELPVVGKKEKKEKQEK